MKKKQMLKTAVIFSCVLFLLMSSIFVWSYFSYHMEAARPFRSQGKNGLWARHQWVGEFHESQDYVKLAEHLKQHEISDVFFHVGPLDKAGMISPKKFVFAGKLVREMKKHCEDVHIQAWIGQIEKKGGGPFDLSDEQVRNNTVQTAKTFLDIGFDGIHYNIEPIYSGNRDFLDLLIKTKTLTDQYQAILSISGDEPEPFPGSDRISRFFYRRAGFWKYSYYKEISNIVGQIAVMMYDTAIPWEFLYGAVVKWQTSRLVKNLGGKTTIFIGVPSYDKKKPGFHPEAENILSGIKGVQNGVAPFDRKMVRDFGIAVYAEWTTDGREWEVFKTRWLGKK